MKNSIKILFVCLLAVGLTSCLKDNSHDYYDREAVLKEEAPILEAYVETTEGLEGAKFDQLNGIWYKVIKEGVQPGEDGYYTYNINGTGYPEAPRITVRYEGKLVSTGFVFDKNDKPEGKEFSLGTLILGWKIGFLPEKLKDKEGNEIAAQYGLTEFGLQEGSVIRLILPSPAGFENIEQPGIPANSPLDFTIEVLKVLPPAALPQ